jgi:hypothetical protein
MMFFSMGLGSDILEYSKSKNGSLLYKEEFQSWVILIAYLILGSVTLV